MLFGVDLPVELGGVDFLEAEARTRVPRSEFMLPIQVS